MFGFTEEEWKEFTKSKKWKKELRHRSFTHKHAWSEDFDNELQLTLFEQPKEEE